MVCSRKREAGHTLLAYGVHIGLPFIAHSIAVLNVEPEVGLKSVRSDE